METRILADADAAAREAARVIAAEARASVAARGRFVLAVSKTPPLMLRALAQEDVPWSGVHLVQVDERVAPAGDPDRNLTQLRESLLENAPLPADHVHAMPVEEADLDTAARRYERVLEAFELRAEVVTQFLEPGARRSFAMFQSGGHGQNLAKVGSNGNNPQPACGKALSCRSASPVIMAQASATLRDLRPSRMGMRRRAWAPSCTSGGTPELSRPMSRISPLWKAKWV